MKEWSISDKLAFLTLFLTGLYALLDHFGGWNTLQSWKHTPFVINLTLVAVATKLLLGIFHPFFSFLYDKYTERQYSKKQWNVLWKYVLQPGQNYRNVRAYCLTDRRELDGHGFCVECKKSIKMIGGDDKEIYMSEAITRMSRYFNRAK